MEGEKPDPDIRRPMQWTSENNASFTTSTPWEALGPNYQTANVAVESADPDSLLSFYKTLIAIRTKYPVLRSGALTLLSTDNSGVYASLRNENNDALLVLANLTNTPISDYTLSLTRSSLTTGSYHITPIMGSGLFADLTVASAGDFSQYKPASEVPAYGTLILQLQSFAGSGK